MKKILGSVAMVGLLALAAAAPRANAQCNPGGSVPLLFHWSANGFSFEGPGPYTGFVSPAGNVMTHVLSPDLLCGPLAALNLNDPTVEYTMVWSGLLSGGTVTTDLGGGSFDYTTVYTGGTFALYAGPINARAYNSGTIPSPATALPQYSDGSVLLSGSIPTLTTTISKTVFAGMDIISGSFRGTYQITGGPAASQFCNAVPVPALMTGSWDPNFPPAGYTAHSNGKFDAPDCTVPTPGSTWGRLKVLYR